MRLQPTQIGLGITATNSNVLQLDYDYGTTANNGNLLSQTITIPGLTLSQQYTYDALNRLETAKENSGSSWKQKFLYDRYGNRNLDTNSANTSPDLVGPNPTLSPTTNRIVAQTGEQYLYDGAGNLTRGRDGQSYTFDGENRMTSFNGGAAQGGADYSYDGDGRRVKKVSGGVTTWFVYDAMDHLIAEYSSAPAENSGTRYVTSDHLGSPRVVTDSNGVVKARHDYHPFGEEVGLRGGRSTTQQYVADNLRLKFTSKQRDLETELDFFIARYYAFKHGRFISADPLLSSGRVENPQTWNRYEYALSNPLKFSDPLGLYEYLAGISAADRQRIDKAYDDLLKARDKYKVGSKEYNAIDTAIKALGAPGQKNGVMVGVDNTLATPGATYSAPEYDQAGKVNGSTSVVMLKTNDFKTDDVGKAQLAGALGHEGTHVADAQSEAARLAGKTMADINSLAASGGIMSNAITEVHAYRVSSYIAAAISPSKQQSTSVNGFEIWNRGWKSADMDKNREVGIRGVLESPKGSYKYRYIPNPISFNLPGLNNSLDNSKQWIVNGGTIFQ